EGEAMVQGTVRLRSLSNDERDHYAEDGAVRPDSLEIQIAAAGIALGAPTP
ncbi:MAG: hypothetical protein GVY25_02485, partial [Bacteroidetes bacterium]|nr:hypothetical protein [Bacteroidota bacterium]